MARTLAGVLVALLLLRPVASEESFQEDGCRFADDDEDAVLLATPSRLLNVNVEVDASSTATGHGADNSAAELLVMQPVTQGATGAAVLKGEGPSDHRGFARAASALQLLEAGTPQLHLLTKALHSSGAVGAASALQLLEVGRGADDTLSDAAAAAADALQHESNQTANAADTLQDVLQHIDDARGAYLSYDSVNESNQTANMSWRLEDVPNPMLEPSSCGQNVSSWICDPESLLGHPEGFLLANATNDSSESAGDNIGKLRSLLDEVQKLPAPSRCEHFRMAIFVGSFLELGASRDAMSTFAEATLERWNVSSSMCGVLLLLSCSDQRVFLATQVGVRELLSHEVASHIVLSMQEDMLDGQYLKAALMATTEVSAMLSSWKPDLTRIARATKAGAAEAKALGFAGYFLFCTSVGLGVGLFCCLSWKPWHRTPY